MKIIDLLNKIANGEEVPKKIEYRNIKFLYDKDNKLYIVDNYNEYNDLLMELSNHRGNDLNYEVEILEEEKKIPEKICTNRIINTKDILEFEMIQNKINAEYTYAINEIIDCLDYLKSKGE